MLSAINKIQFREKILSVKGGAVDHVGNLVSFEKKLASSGGKLVVVDFTATWCGPCKMIAPTFESFSNSPEFMGKAVFVKVDVDEANDVAVKYQVNSMPTFLFIRDSKVLERFSGASVEKLKSTIQRLTK